MEEKTICRGFPPLCGDKSRVLILGTFPSPLSRDKGEYYGNPRNQFWRIIYEVFDNSYTGQDYEQRKSFLVINGIAVWDVIAACEVEGALDSAIRNPVYNLALPEFIKEHAIRKVFFNGNNAYMFYKRGIANIEKIVLPSTSPAYATMSFDDKCRLWKDKLSISV